MDRKKRKWAVVLLLLLLFFLAFFWNSQQPKPEKAASLTKAALSHFQTGNVAEAKQTAEMAIRHDPNNLRGHRVLAWVALKEKRRPEALVHLKKVAEQRGDDPAPHLALAVLYYAEGEVVEAKREMEIAKTRAAQVGGYGSVEDPELRVALNVAHNILQNNPSCGFGKGCHHLLEEAGFCYHYQQHPAHQPHSTPHVSKPSQHKPSQHNPSQHDTK